MKTLGYLALGLSVLMMLACSGSGGGGSGPAAVVTPAALPSVNGLSSDIQQVGNNYKIVRKTFSISSGSGHLSKVLPKAYEDKCAGLADDRDFDITPPALGLQKYQVIPMVLTFDPNGNLTVTLSGAEGQTNSPAILPVPFNSNQQAINTYSIGSNGSQPIIQIGGFTNVGTPTLTYVTKTLADIAADYPIGPRQGTGGSYMSTKFEVMSIPLETADPSVNGAHINAIGPATNITSNGQVMIGGVCLVNSVITLSNVAFTSLN